MAFVGWFLCTVLSVLLARGTQDAQTLTAPEEVKVFTEGDSKDFGVWKMNIEWKDGFTNSITPDKVTYDIRIFYTEQRKLVHNETIELKANQMGYYKWSWTSPIPLQCTSHSVQLRYREKDHTSAWTPLETLPGRDTSDIKEVNVYPQNHWALVSEGIRFCCILKPEHNERFNSSNFTIRISNRTYVTKPIRHSHPSPPEGFDILCENGGSTYYIGYAPDDYNLTCETRDLSSVECHWIEGQKANLETKYSINGRYCTPRFCVLNQTIDTGVMNWTLTAKNNLGTKIIFDTADPKHRVHLKAPTLNSTTMTTARKATLEWKWHGQKYSSFPMICQVEVNGHISNENFEGIGLSSMVLVDLQPFTTYEARVRCGSSEHFYKWGDWSNLITFTTKEDIPEAVDVWMQFFGEQTYVVWKSLSAAQSHGIITGYELVMGNSTDRNKERMTKSPAEFCHKLRADQTKTHHVISITAENSAGVSRPSSITIPNLSPGGGVNTSDIIGNNGAFDMVWKQSTRSTCGYVLDWYPTYKAQQCAVKWKKFPSGVTNATIYSDFKEGVKYTLSVYGCTSGAPYLLKRREGYMIELSPSGVVQNLKAKQEGLDVYLSWENVHEEEQRGFIRGYKVFYTHAGGDKGNVVTSKATTQKFSLSVATYTFTVKAFTSAGDGPESEITLSMDPQVDLVIVNVAAGLVVMIFVLCIIAVLTYKNWKWLKSTLWPEVPKPMLSEEFLKKTVYQWQVMDQLLCEESDMLKVKSPDHCPALIVLEPEKEDHEEQANESPHSKDSPCSEGYQIPTSDPQNLPLIATDLSYKELPCPGIQNPTYNMPLAPAPDNSLVSGYIPQMQKGGVQHQPSDAHWWSHSPSNVSEMHHKDRLII